MADWTAVAAELSSERAISTVKHSLANTLNSILDMYTNLDKTVSLLTKAGQAAEGVSDSLKAAGADVRTACINIKAAIVSEQLAGRLPSQQVTL